LRLLLIVLAAFIPFSNALLNGFVSDDIYLVENNPFIKSWDNLPHIFSAGYWQSKNVSGGLYRPLALFSFLVEHTFVGLKPFLYHLDNVLLHVLCSLLVFNVLKYVFDDENAVFFSAMIFAVHPVHTEAVAWVSGRAELLAAFFMLLSLYLFLRNRQDPRMIFLSVCAFFFGLLSKESAVITPAVIFLYLMLFENGQPFKKKLASSISRMYPYIAAFSIYMAIRLLVLRGSIGPQGSDQVFLDTGPSDIFLTMSMAFTHYLRLAVLPFGLSLDYVYPPPSSLLQFNVLFPLAVLGFVVLAAWFKFFSRPALFALLVFFIALAPVSNIIPTGIRMSERAMYLPSLAPCILLGGLFSINLKRPAFPAMPRGSLPVLTSALLFFVILIFSINTYKRNPYWNNQEGFIKAQIDFFRQRVRLYPYVSDFHSKLAILVSIDAGSRAEIEMHARKALELNPLDYKAHYALASFYESNFMLDEAFAESQKAIELNPDDADIINLQGLILYRMKRYDEAVAMFDKALSINPASASFTLNKAGAIMDNGEWDEAFKYFEKAAQLNPDSYEAFLNMGIITGARGEYSSSISNLERASRLKPRSPEAHYYLAVANIGLGRHSKAMIEIDTALKLKPGYKEAVSLSEQLR
jgi:Tfp pilus assembly protein PilF